MSKRISENQQGVANRGLAKAQISKKNVDELQASVVESAYSNFSYSIGGVVGSGDSINVLINKGEIIFRNFSATGSNKPLTKYRYAEAFLKLFNFLEQLAQKSKKNKDGVLLESYEVWVPISNPSNNKQSNKWLPPKENVASFTVGTENKMRPWTSLLPRRVTDIPVFSNKNINSCAEYILRTNPDLIEYKEQGTEPAANYNVSTLEPSIDEAGAMNKEEPRFISIEFNPTDKLYRLYKEYDKSDPKDLKVLNDFKIEALAIAIEALSPTKIPHTHAETIAKELISKFKTNVAHSVAYSALINNITLDPSEKLTIPVAYSFSMDILFILETQYTITLRKDIVELITGAQQKELEKIFGIDKVKVRLEKYFQTLDKRDYLELLKSILFHRLLLVQYLEDDFKELSEKRGSWFFKNFEGYYSNQFPSDLRESFKKYYEIIQVAHHLINGKSIIDENIEKALLLSNIVNQGFLAAQKRLKAYEKDKDKWSKRAIAFMTLAIEALTAVLTSGIMTWTKSMRIRSVIQSIILPLAKQELYVQSGLINKRDFAALAKDTVISFQASKISTTLSNQFINKFNLDLNKFSTKVIDTLLTNFADAFQSEIINLIKFKTASIDDFLFTLFENLVTDLAGKGVVHNAAVHAAHKLRQSDLGAKILIQDKSIMADADLNLNDQRALPKSKPEPSTVGLPARTSIAETQQLAYRIMNAGKTDAKARNSVTLLPVDKSNARFSANGLSKVDNTTDAGKQPRLSTATNPTQADLPSKMEKDSRQINAQTSDSEKGSAREGIPDDANQFTPPKSSPKKVGRARRKPAPVQKDQSGSPNTAARATGDPKTEDKTGKYPNRTSKRTNPETTEESYEIDDTNEPVNDDYWKDRLSRAQEFDIAGYKALTAKGELGRPFDNLDSDEALQNLFLRQFFGVSRTSKDIKENPAVALNPEIHRMITNLQKDDIRGLTAEQVLAHHINEMRRIGEIPNDVIIILEREALNYIHRMGL